MRQLMRDDIESTSQIIKSLPTEGNVWWQPFPVNHDSTSAADVERIDVEIKRGVNLWNGGLARNVMHKAEDTEVVVIEALSPKPLEVVVVDVTRLRVRVDRRPVC